MFDVGSIVFIVNKICSVFLRLNRTQTIADYSLNYFGIVSYALVSPA